MLTSLLDTSICIRALRDRPAGFRARLVEEFDAVCVSSIVRYELYVGASLSTNGRQSRDAIDDFLSVIPCLSFDDQAAYHAADIRAVLTREGNIIGPNDLLIAGHARSQGLKVITGNLKEFSRVDGLICEDWS